MAFSTDITCSASFLNGRRRRCSSTLFSSFLSQRDTEKRKFHELRVFFHSHVPAFIFPFSWSSIQGPLIFLKISISAIFSFSFGFELVFRSFKGPKNENVQNSHANCTELRPCSKQTLSVIFWRKKFHTTQFFSTIIVTFNDISVQERRFETVKSAESFVYLLHF